jgi:hypothetical protein
MTKHATGTREEWVSARKELLEREKELTRQSDELARQRRALPWVAIEKVYEFETNEGTNDRRQLLLPVVLPHLGMLPDRPSRLLPGELAYEASVELQDAACPAVPMLTVSTRSPRERANAPAKPQRGPRARAARFPRSPRSQDHRVTSRSRREVAAP